MSIEKITYLTDGTLTNNNSRLTCRLFIPGAVLLSASIDRPSNGTFVHLTFALAPAKR
jgi:hypothetical protein